MTPPDRHELLDEALSHARRLARGLRMMEADALGMAADFHRRDLAMAVVARIIVDLEDALKKEKAA